MDATLTGALAAFAWWTLLYEVMLAARWPTTPVTIGWLVTAPIVTVVVARWHVTHLRRAELADQPQLSRPVGALGQWPRTVLALAIPAIVCAVAMATTTHARFRLGWGIGLVCLLVVAHTIHRGASRPSLTDGASAAESDGAGSTPRTRDHMVAVAVSCAVAIVSLFLIKTASDDAYYVNLSTWIAEHGRIPLRDTMYGNLTYPSSYGGGFPLSSIETQIGALARIFGMRAGTMAYLVVAPLCSFASIWVLWMLARLWSRGRALPAFLYSVAFILAGTGGAYRSYSTTRIWEGKVMAFAIVVPLIWIFATRLARTSDRHWTVLLGLAGLAFTGLTSTAALVGLTLACAIALAAVVLANRELLWGAIALAVSPLVSGLLIAVLSRKVGGENPTAPTAWAAVRDAYGAPPSMVMLTIAAVLISPLLVRGTAAATLIWSGAVASFAVLIPGVLGFLNSVTGSGPVEWRLLLTPTVPMLIGLCVAAGARAAVAGLTSRPAIAKTVSLAATVAVVVAFTVVGTPPWTSGIRLETKPSWKVSVSALTDVRAFVAANPPTAGPVLMPAAEMGVLAIYTTRWYAVVPRAFDLRGLVEPAATTTARRTLLRLVSISQPNPSAAKVKWALQALNVSAVCLDPRDVAARTSVRAAGYPAFQSIGGMRCSIRTS